MKPIWIVDDDQSIRFVLEKALTREEFVVRSFTNPRDVLAALEDDQPQVLVSDIRMPGGSGLDLLNKIKAKHRDLPVIIMTAYSDLDSAVSAFQGGAFDYLPKPFDVPKAVDLIRRAVEESLHEGQAEAPAAQVPEILGQAPAMQDVFRAIGRLSQSIVTVLITGESGSGKELVANALHKHSPRASGPFVAINTAAIPKDLLESELFGHERGAFTGAQTTRRGRFEQADGGTLFLDEIGDMPFDLQTRLLRVLADGQFYRVGGHNPMRSNVRVIAATHQDLEERVKAGSFREDALLPAEERARARRRRQAHHRGGAGAAHPLRLSRQCAPAREHLPLADGDGAGAARRRQGPAARVPAEAAGATGRPAVGGVSDAGREQRRRHVAGRGHRGHHAIAYRRRRRCVDADRGLSGCGRPGRRELAVRARA